MDFGLYAQLNKLMISREHTIESHTIYTIYTRRLRSSLTHQLDVRQSQCATVGDRAFATAGARLWNSLPADIVACDTLPQFRRELKTFMFRQS